jgi:hypothetical protein
MTKITQRMPKAIPTTAAQMANLLAFAEACSAPATSPMAHLLLTCVEKTIEAMPRGKPQPHRIVDRIAQTR